MSSGNWDDPYKLEPALPVGNDLEDLRDLAQDVLTGSRDLEVKLAPETAQAIGDKLRILNSLFSNQIEGHFTTFLEIENRLGLKEREPVIVPKTEDQYAAELGEAHVNAETALVRLLASQPEGNVSHPDFIRHIHRTFFDALPPEHQFTHSAGGFTKYPVMPGVFRDGPVRISTDDGESMPIGPMTTPDLDANMRLFGRIFHPDSFRGGEAKIIAAAAGHAKLAWLHPFRDGNGRSVRLYTSLFLARCGINRANLWSLSRGLAEKKGRYFTGLRFSNPGPTGQDRNALTFQSENTAAGCNIFLNICKDQIAFMHSQLMLNTITERIERFAETQLGTQYGKNKSEAGRILRAVFNSGRMERQEAYAVLGGLGEKTAQRIINGLVNDGYLKSDTHRAPLTIGLPPTALREYFPRIYNEAIMPVQDKGKAQAAASPQKKSQSPGSGFDLEK